MAYLWGKGRWEGNLTERQRRQAHLWGMETTQHRTVSWPRVGKAMSAPTGVVGFEQGLWWKMRFAKAAKEQLRQKRRMRDLGEVQYGISYLGACCDMSPSKVNSVFECSQTLAWPSCSSLNKNFHRKLQLQGDPTLLACMNRLCSHQSHN